MSDSLLSKAAFEFRDAEWTELAQAVTDAEEVLKALVPLVLDAYYDEGLPAGDEYSWINVLGAMKRLIDTPNSEE